MAADRAIRVAGLRKTYPGTVAVDGIDLEVSRGEVFSLLGPNGAGKTTTVEILEGYRSRDAGEVRVLGADPVAVVALVQNVLPLAIGVVFYGLDLPDSADRWLTYLWVGALGRVRRPGTRRQLGARHDRARARPVVRGRAGDGAADLPLAQPVGRLTGPAGPGAGRAGAGTVAACRRR